MKSLIRTLSLLLIAGAVITACSKTKPAEGTGTAATPAVSAPVQQPPSGQTVEPAQQELPKAAPKPATPAKKPVKPATPPTPPSATAENVPPAPAPAAVPSPAAPRAENPPVAPAPRHITIPEGTMIVVRTIDSVDSRTDKAGQTFRASMDADVIVDNERVLLKGDAAYLQLILATSAGEIRGKSQLQLQLDRIVIGKNSYAIESSVVERSASAEGPKTARDIGIGAAIGAAIGAIKGGGKGAAIGAGAGAGAGATVAAITKGEQVLVPSETRLEFRLERPVDIPLRTTPRTSNSLTESSAGSKNMEQGERNVK